jgi:NhaP-type Na+/H+ or K+/H+ antiporter
MTSAINIRQRCRLFVIEEEFMLLSISLILLVGMSMSWICRKIKLPGLLGMLVTGIVLGPYMLDLLDESILGISSELRKIALIIILTRAGLGLDLSGLKKIGRPAVLMCFVPASLEILGMILLAPKLMGLTVLEAAIMGAVLAAVSPAVVVPRMVRLMDEGYGVNKGIPQLILAGASVDDVYVIVLFSTFTGMMQGESASVTSFLNVPVSIFLGGVLGLLLGTFFAYYLKKVHLRDTAKVLIILSVSFLLVVIEDHLNTPITFSALIAIMFIGIGLQKKREAVAKRLSVKYGKLWVGAEVFLFVLVGATVNIEYFGKVGVQALAVILGALVFRMLGVFICLPGTDLTGREKMFCMLAYTPKATVQAAIGGIPLSLGFACGDMVLTVAVLAIVLTAPLGALAIDSLYKKWLVR